MVKTADTHVLIIVLTNMQKLAASMRVWLDVWLETGLGTNNTLRYVNVNTLHQALCNNLCVALIYHTYILLAMNNRHNGKTRPGTQDAGQYEDPGPYGDSWPYEYPGP